MQPPPRGSAGADEVVERIRAWAKRPTAEATLALCDELRAHPDVRGNHVDVLAKAVLQRHAKSAPILISLGRLQLTIGKLGDAQQTLVTAGRLDPDLRTPYRLLGEVLLRRGDAVRAERMFSRCVELDRASGEVIEDRTDEWLRKSKALRALQDSQGEGAVASEVARDLPVAGRAKSSTSTQDFKAVRTGTGGSLRAPAPVASPTDDQPTQVGAIPDNVRKKWKPETNKFDEVLDNLETQQNPAYKKTGQAIDERPAQPLPPAAPPKPSTVPPPFPRNALNVAPTPLPPLVAGLPAPAKIPAGPPIPAVRGPAMVQPKPSAPVMPAAPSITETSEPGMQVREGDLIDSAEHPTIRRGDDDDDATLPAPPRAADDLSPLPQHPLHTTPHRALRPDSVTLGDDGLRPAAAKAADARVKNPFAAATQNPFASAASAPAPRATAPTDLDQPWPTQQVLSALAEAGIYEREGVAGSPGAWMSRRDISRPRRRGSIAMYVFLFLFVGGGIGGGLYYGHAVKKRHQIEAEEKSLVAETEVHKGGLEALGNAEMQLTQVFELDSRSLRGARVWLQDRVLRSYVWPSENRKEGGLASAIERGKAVGLNDVEMSYARIALALSSDDTVGAAAIAKALDPGAATDKDAAWTELTVGWVLERAGDARAVERYAHAAALDPEMVTARLYLAKLAAIAGDAERTDTLTKDVPPDLVAAREDLLALASLIKGDTTIPKPGAEGVRRPYGFGWIVSALVVADPKAPADKRKAEAEKAVQLADSPADLTRIGRLAAAAGDEATASRAALRALEVSPIFTPARALAARLALLVGRPDDAARALEGAPAEPEINALRAWLAYERGDLAAVDAAFNDAGIIDKKAFDRADLASLVKPLRYAQTMAQRPSGALKPDELKALSEIAALGELGPLVAFDVALDTGTLKIANDISTAWQGEGNIELRPTRALRLARLARLNGKGEDADKLSKIAVEQGTVVPRAMVERVLVLCALGKGAEGLALLNRFQLLATDEQPWLKVYATAQAGKVPDAKKLLADLKDPEKKTATWFVKRDALLAMAAVDDDKRAKLYLKDLQKERPGDADVQTVAKSLGVK